jgi:hypothetical protein
MSPDRLPPHIHQRCAACSRSSKKIGRARGQAGANNGTVHHGGIDAKPKEDRERREAGKEDGGEKEVGGKEEIGGKEDVLGTEGISQEDTD